MKESGLEFIKHENGRDYYFYDLDKLDMHETKDGYNAVCPVCKKNHELGIDGFYLDPNYSKRKLGINQSRSIAHCFRCDSVIVSLRNGDAVIRVPKIHFKNLIGADDFMIDTLLDVSEKYDQSKEITDPMRKLLEMRSPGIDPDALGMKSARWNRPNILTPFYLNGSLIYYQLRFLDKITPKYFSPPIKNKPIYIPRKDYTSDIIICEGVYDAIALLKLYPDWTPVAILGSAITDYQCRLIRKYLIPDRIKIFMDDVKLSDKIKLTLMDTPLAYYVVDIEVVTEHDGEDPEEVLRGNGKIEIADIYESLIQET